MATADTSDQSAPAPQVAGRDPATTATSRDGSPAAGLAGTATAEHGGPKGPEPTRYGDWERGGRCIDF